MDEETCPCPGWARIVCWLADRLGATFTRRRWLYRWHMRFVSARFDEAFEAGTPVEFAQPATITWTPTPQTWNLTGGSSFTVTWPPQPPPPA